MRRVGIYRYSRKKVFNEIVIFKFYAGFVFVRTNRFSYSRVNFVVFFSLRFIALDSTIIESISEVKLILN